MDKDEGYDPWRAVKEYYDVFLAEIENWELKYGKRPTQGAVEAVNRPGVSQLLETTTKEPITWRVAPVVVNNEKENETVDSTMHEGKVTEKPFETTTKSSEQNYPTETNPKPTTAPKTTDMERIFAQLATWKKPTESPLAQIPLNIPGKGDDGEVIYTPILPEAPTKVPKNGKEGVHIPTITPQGFID